MHKKLTLFLTVLTLLACLLVAFQTNAFASDTVSGDINGDTTVTSADAIYLLRHAMNPSRFPISVDCADMNGDGSITSADAIYLLRHAMSPNRFPLHTHTWNDDWARVDDNVHGKTCTACSFVLKADHSYDDGVITSQPDCKNDGVMTYTCSACGGEKTTPTGLNPNGHKWGDGVVTKQPTSSEVGTTTYTCSLCGDTKTEDIPKLTTFDLSASWKIVYPSSSTQALEAYRYLKDGINSLYGYTYTYKKDSSIAKGDYEILLSNTNRTEDDALNDGMRVGEYGYHILSDKVIVITGGNGEDILNAAKKFMSDAFGYTGTGTGEAASLMINKKYVSKASYPVSSFKIEGIDISNYSIAYYGDSFKQQATMIQDRIGELVGAPLPLVNLKNATQSVKTSHAIYVGTVHVRTEDYSYSIWSDNGNVKISCGTQHVNDAINVFLAQVIPSTLTGDVNITTLSNGNTLCNYYFTNSKCKSSIYWNSWRFNI